jgi:DNA ligase-1
MRAFARLYEALDRTTSTNAKVEALRRYLAAAPPGDAAWALFFLTGRRLKRHLPSRLMHEWTLEVTGLSEWIVEESYHAAGDFAEAIALLVEGRLQPTPVASFRRAVPGIAARLPFEQPDAGADTADDAYDLSLADWMERRILPLRDRDDEEKRVRVLAWWSQLPRDQLFLLNKLLTGEFRVGVSHTLVVRALALSAGLPAAVVEHRIMGAWEPSAQGFAALVAPEDPAGDPSRPYPFCLASPLDGDVAVLGPRQDWLVEWKWDGIRAQLIRRAGRVFLWSRGEELISDRFPEVGAAAAQLADGTVLDGEVLAFGPEGPRPFADLQRRIGRHKRVVEMAGAVPVAFVAYDLLEHDGADIRSLTLRDRRNRLHRVIERSEPPLRLSEELTEPTWDALQRLRSESRARNVEGLMVKRWSSPYQTGRKRGDWWKWKIEPHTLDAVLIYAQPGSGRRATLFTDYTFGVWDDSQLVPVAKAYSGLNDQEIDELDRWVRRHTVERFGPVSAVEPVHVFELGFERIASSARHKSGVAVRFPRILRWRRDKKPAEADTLETLRKMIQ